jgi:hypothetical protein
MAGLLVIGLSFVYMFAYVSVTAPLEFTMLAVALLWRNEQWQRGADRAADPAGSSRSRVGVFRRPGLGRAELPAARL